MSVSAYLMSLGAYAINLNWKNTQSLIKLTLHHVSRHTRVTAVQWHG